MSWMKTGWIAVAALVAIAPAAGFAQDKSLIPLRIATLKIAAQTDVWVAQQRGIYGEHRHRRLVAAEAIQHAT